MWNSPVATTTTGICTVMCVKGMTKGTNTPTIWNVPEAVKIRTVLSIVTGVNQANFVKTSLTMKTVPASLAERQIKNRHEVCTRKPSNLA